MDYQEICEQVDSVATHQLVLLDGLAQALRPRVTDDVPLDEALTLAHTVMALNGQMLRWARVVLAGEAPAEDAVCEVCREAEERGDGE
mgnify:CR=1 FL=1